MTDPSHHGPSAAVARRRATALTVVLGALCLPLLLAGETGTWSWAPLALLAMCVVLTELRPVHVARNGQRHSFTLTEGPLVAALTIAPGRPVVLAVVVGLLAAQLVRRLPNYKVAFNIAQFAAATSAASLVAGRVDGAAGVLLAVLAFMSLNDGSVRLVIALTTGRPPGRLGRDANAVWLLHVAAVVSIAVLGASVYLVDVTTLPAFIAPALLVLWSQEQATRHRVHMTVLDALASQATAFYGRSSEETAILLARTARDVLAASRTELVLLGAESLVVLTAGADGVERTRLDNADLITDWRGRVFEQASASADGVWAGAVVGREVPRALLGIWRDDHQEPFRPADVALLQTLADTVGDWLSATEQEEHSLLSLRRRVLELGGSAEGMADALGLLASVRQDVAAAPLTPARAAAVAADLKEVEQRVASFVSGLMVEQVTPAHDDVIATGHWVRTS